jgi:putative ABC transport system permease protein
MKTIIRNFLRVLRRYRLATTLNILGLSVAFAMFILIMMQVDFDRNFDRFHRDTEHIFRMEVKTQDEWATIANVPLPKILFESSPHIVAGTIVKNWTNGLFFSVDTTENRSFFQEQNYFVTPGYTSVFPFDMAEGSAHVLEEPGSALIPQSLAKRLFGDKTAVGRMLFDREGTYTVRGVYRDFPQNASVPNVIYLPLPIEKVADNWNYWAFQCYFRLNDAKNIAGLKELLKERMRETPFAKALPDDSPSENIRFVALSDIHYMPEVKFDTAPKTTRQTLLILTTIALLVLIVGGINYFNFSTALTPKRMKSINLQKVAGASNVSIRMALVFESVAICAVSWLIALLFVYGAQYTPVASLIDGGITYTNLRPFAYSGLLALLTGCLTGIYPAYYMTSFSPAMVLKGSFGQSARGRQFRNLLMSVQFVTSMTLIIYASFMYLQNHYMRHTPLGYDRDELIVVNFNDRLKQERESFENRLKSFPEIAGIAYANDQFAARDFYNIATEKYRDRDVLYQYIQVSPSFLDIMGIKVYDGRGFRPEDAGSQGVWVFNRKAQEDFGLELNGRFNNMEIIGFMPDLKIASFRVLVEPLGLFVKNDQNSFHVAYIKVNADNDLRKAMMHVRQTLAGFDPYYPFNVHFFDEILDNLYAKELKRSLLITLFSLVAIFISMVGVFGLVVFDSEYRRREIGIRKVFGSTSGEILVTFNRSYIRILCVCFVLSAPVAWYAVSQWLENFVYRTPMYWWIYLAAFVAVFILTVCTVTFQNWHAAGMNPVESIKEE